MATIIKGKNARRPHTVRYWVDGRQRERSFQTGREAKDFKIKVEHDARAQIFIEPDIKSTVSSYFGGWLTRHAGTEGTKRVYQSVYDNRIAPVLGDKPLGKVSREDVNRLLLDDLPTEIGPAAVRTARTLLVAMFGEALKSGKIAANPAAGIRLPNGRSHRAEFTMATREQLDALAAKLPAEWRLSVWLMRGCGLRIGEALGVRHEDVRGDMLRVERQRLQDGSYGPLKGRREGQYRDVPLPAYVADMIEPGQGDLFPPGRTDTYRDRFTRAAKAAGLAGYHPHMLRHTYASVMLAAGVPLFEVSRYLGHRSADFTAEVYGHLVPSAASRARLVLDSEHAEWSAPAQDDLPLSA